MLPLYLVYMASALACVWIFRHAPEETVGVMAVSIAAILFILGIVWAPWPLQLGGLLLLLIDRVRQQYERII